MMTQKLLTRCASLAIAASLALPAIPSAAQDPAGSEPAIVLPEIPAAPDAALAIVLPESTREALVAAPAQAQTQTNDAAPAREPVAATNVPLPASAAQPAPAPREAAHPVRSDGDTPVSSVESESDTSAAALPAAVRAPAPAEIEAAPLSAEESATDELALAAILGALGLAAVGGVAYAAARRRRLRDIDREHDPLNLPRDGEGSGPGPQERIDGHFPHQSSGRTSTPQSLAAPLGRTLPSSLIARGSGDPVPLPAAVPESFEERDALLRQLVAAKPDRANPFTSPRARSRRAKLIIQSLARDFTTRKPRIDLSEYTHRWPALRGWQPATA